MRWPWQQKEHPSWELEDPPTLDDIARGEEEVLEARRRLREVEERERLVDHRSSALAGEKRINHLGPVIAKALRAREGDAS